MTKTTANFTSKSDLYSKVNKLTPDQQFEMETTPKLQGMRLAELQALAQKYVLSTEKQGKTKMISMTKKELVVAILDYHKNA